MKIPELISSLIAKELQGKITLGERKILDEWYNQPDLRGLEPINTNRAANLKRVHKKIPLYPTSILPFKWLGWAAAVLIFCFGLTQVYFPDQSERLETVGLDETFEIVDNPRGVRRKLLMPDSSVIHLNGGSRLQIQNSFLTNRTVILEGEAYFEVAKDPENPFVVITEGLVTQVLGTSFSVSAYKGKPQRVAVKEGKVNVKEALGNFNQKQELLANELVTYQKGQGLGAVTLINSNHLFAWVDGTVVFVRTPIMEVFETLSNWYGLDSIQINDTDMNCSVTGTYTRMTLEEIMESIEYATGITYELNGKKLNVKKGNC